MDSESVAVGLVAGVLIGFVALPIILDTMKAQGVIAQVGDIMPTYGIGGGCIGCNTPYQIF